MNNTAYYFVHESHPAIALLRANVDLLGVNVDLKKKVEGEW